MMNIYRERERERDTYQFDEKFYRQRERDINLVKFTEEREREGQRGISILMNILFTERERGRETGISILMKIYRDRERDINFEEKEKQGVLLLVTKSAEVILHKSPTVPNILSLCGRLESGRAGTPV